MVQLRMSSERKARNSRWKVRDHIEADGTDFAVKTTNENIALTTECVAFTAPHDMRSFQMNPSLS